MIAHYKRLGLAIASFPEQDSAHHRLKLAGWKIAIEEANRGYCNYHQKLIVIPLWAVTCNEDGRLVQYIAHEIAHAIAGPNEVHSVRFMEVMKSLCPPSYWHYETGYKPRNAKSAGISSNHIENQLPDILGGI